MAHLVRVEDLPVVEPPGVGCHEEEEDTPTYLLGKYLLLLRRQAAPSRVQQRCFYDINLSGLHTAALNEVLRQPIVDTFDMQVLMSGSARHHISFLEDEEEALRRIEIPFVFKLLQSGLVHGLAFWFDVAFSGSTSTVWFSTAPTEPLTHWYQVRCLLQTP
ncbi:hypothetical protein CRUP_002923, partial [Coryphaenoides rupestris]